MTVKWLIQDSGKNVMLQNNFDTIRQLGYHYEGFGLIEGKSEIINLENILTDIEESYIIRGGTKILHLLTHFDDLELLCPNLNNYQKENKNIFLKKLKSGMFYDNKKFDQHYYNQLNIPLLNAQADFLSIGQNLDKTFDVAHFIKPSKDFKTFTHGIIKPGQTLKNFITSSQHLSNYCHETALVAPVQRIIKEYRFFIVDDEVISGSQYKEGDKVHSNAYIPSDVLEAAKQYATLYQPHEIFTMDLATTSNGIKIVEYNCWNGSGLYKCDKLKVFTSVHSLMKKKHEVLTSKINKLSVSY